VHPAAVRALIDIVRNVPGQGAGVNQRLTVFEEHFRSGRAAGASPTCTCRPPPPIQKRKRHETYEQPAPGMTCDKPAPDAGLRRVIRANVLTVWGAVLLANAVAHVVLVYTLPIDLISGVTTVEWFASLALLITWHVWYIRKENLDA
jgi:hypothetical protein